MFIGHFQLPYQAYHMLKLLNVHADLLLSMKQALKVSLGRAIIAIGGNLWLLYCIPLRIIYECLLISSKLT